MSAAQVVAGRYRLGERLGGGGMGVVWQAHDETLRRTVAVKEVTLPPSLDDERLAEIRRRTMREGRIAAKLHHPQLITVYDVIEDEGRPYLIMEYLPATSLAEVLAERGTLPPEEVARIGAQAAAALAAAHAAAVVHRDVKPSNILVGDSGTVKITDFGVSRVVEDVTGTATGTFVGTPAYLAPEVARGKEVTFASDVYSLGATLYTAVEGAPPAGTSDNPMRLLHRISSGTITPPRQAGPLAELLVRMLSADPAQRPTMQDAKRALDDLASGHPSRSGTPTPAPAEPTAEPAHRTPRRRAVLLALVCVLIAVTTTLVVLNTTGEPTAGTATPDPTSAAPDRAEPGADAGRPPAAEPSTAPETTQPTAPEPTQPPANPAPTSPTAAVTGYYDLMPGNPDEGWNRLTPKFRLSPAGGPEGYRSYWSTIRDVSATGASGQGSTVQVTVTYSFTSGRRTREVHRYQLVQENGGWLIDTVAVVSSTDLP